MAKAVMTLSKDQIITLLKNLFEAIKSSDSAKNEITASLNLVTIYSKMYVELCSNEIIKSIEKKKENKEDPDHSLQVLKPDLNESLEKIVNLVKGELTILLKNKKINYATTISLIKEVGNALDSTRKTHLDKVKSLQSSAAPDLDDSWSIVTADSSDPEYSANASSTSAASTSEPYKNTITGDVADIDQPSNCTVS
jgi:hypothetical protein